MKIMSPLLLIGLLAGCAPQLEGAYFNDAGAQAFTLAHGKYYGTSASEARAPRHSVPIPYPYKVDGKTGDSGPVTTAASLCSPASNA